jgi:hypothetical protein
MIKAIVFDIGQTLTYYPIPLNWSNFRTDVEVYPEAEAVLKGWKRQQENNWRRLPEKRVSDS